MKKILLTLALVLGVVTTAHAAVQEFQDVKADVPEDWMVQEQGPMVLLIAPTKDSVVSILCAPSEGMTAKQIAENGANATKGTPVKKEANGAYSFTFEAEGQKGKMTVSEKAGKALAITSGGPHPMVDKVVKSVTFK